MATEAERRYAEEKIKCIRDAVEKKDLDRHNIWKDANHYRTTYKDLCDGMETAVKSDFPSGYGGHIPSIRHDVLHRGTDFDTVLKSRYNENRDYIKPFHEIKDGKPWYTQNPWAKNENPKFGTIPLVNDLIVPPYAILKPLRPPPCYRNAEATCDALEFGQKNSTTYEHVGVAVTSQLPDPSPARFLRNSEGTFYGKTTRDCVPVNDQTVIVNGMPFDRAQVTAIRRQGLDPTTVLTKRGNASSADVNATSPMTASDSMVLQEDRFVKEARDRCQTSAAGKLIRGSDAGETHRVLQKEFEDERSPLSAAGYSTLVSNNKGCTGPLPLSPAEHSYNTGAFSADHFDAVKAARGPGHSHLANITSNYTSTFAVNERNLRR